jgi:trimethylamine--corrinoid protein Co-methyltransferase
MSRSAGRRRRVTPETLNPCAIPQLERQVKRNRFAPIAALEPEQVELIHDASMDILEQLGVEVMGQQALDLFKQAGADVDEGGVVRMDRALVMDIISTAPAQFALTPRNSANALQVGSNIIQFGLTSGPPNVHDCVNGRRIGNFADYEHMIRFGQYFNVIDFFGNQAVAPTDLPPNSRHLDTTFATLTLADKVFFAQGIGAGRVKDAVAMNAIANGMSLQEVAQTPATMTNININSPRKLDDSMAYGAMQMAKMGQAVTVTPFTLMGAMTPTTMAAALAQQNAEALLGIALVQLTKAGAPVVYGGFTSNVDMRSGAPAFGTPENCLANMASGQMARRYNLPYRTSACNASNAVDGQAVYETQMALWGSILGHGNLIYHAAGWLEGGLVASFEKIIMDCEMLQHMTAILKPLKIDRIEIGLEAMEEVGPGGHFFGCSHTMERYQSAFYQPFLSDWKNYENWVEAGSKDATMRATAIWQKILAEFEPPPIAPERREELEAYVANRKQSLGRAEPQLEPIEGNY